jgi:hypothetical protein
MKLLHTFLVLIVLGLFFGCISMMEDTVPPIQPDTAPSCRIVLTQEPYSAEVCQNVSKMEEVCATKALNYSLVQTNKTYLCTEKELCVAHYSSGKCALKYCSKGMTRCLANLTNLDPQKSGTWSVSATFTVDSVELKKNPETETLLPGESAIFDFSQFYDMDQDQKTAECKIFVSTPAKVQDCSFITKIAKECKNETKYKEVEQKICE